MEASIWSRSEERPERPAPLSRERIVDAAVVLLDRNGVEGLTMRRLAEGLAVTATALYWHVRTKDDVLDLALDQIFGELELPAPAPRWQTDVRYLIRGWRAVMLRHPWSPGLIGRPMLGPNVLARTAFLQAALTRAGVTGVDLAVFTRLLANYVIGAALTEATFRRTARPQATADPDGWDDDDLFDRGLDAVLAEVDVAARRPAGAPAGRREDHRGS